MRVTVGICLKGHALKGSPCQITVIVLFAFPGGHRSGGLAVLDPPATRTNPVIFSAYQANTDNNANNDKKDNKKIFYINLLLLLNNLH